MHVSVGATTVRLSDAAARELQGALTRAFAEVDGPRQSFAPTPVIHLVSTLANTRSDDDPDDGGPQFH